MTEFITPPAVSPGDRIAVVAPSGGGAATARHVLALGCDRLRDHFDVRPVVHPSARQSDEYLRANPRARAAAIHEAHRDPDLGGVIATIGGDDQLRVLDHLDPATLREHPTRFLGISDNTNLSLFLWKHGIVSCYGGQLMNHIASPGPLHEYTERYVRQAFFEESLGDFEPAEEWADLAIGWNDPGYATADPGYQPATGHSWAGGDHRVEGRVWGGCLAVLEWQLMADRYLPRPGRLDGAVLAVETAEDLPPAKRVRWALMSMGERGLLERFSAVLVGRPATQNWREPRTTAERESYRQSQRDAIREEVCRYNPDAPIVFDAAFGHTNPTAPIPIGGLVEIDPTRERITFR